jgi:integrase
MALLGDIARGAHSTGSHMTLRQWSPKWIDTHGREWEAGTVKERSETMDRYVLPHLGTTRLRDLSRRLVREWRTGLLEDGVTTYRAQRSTSILSACLGAAVADDIIDANPCAGLKALTWKRAEHDPIPVDHVEAVRARITSASGRACVSLMAYAGCRPSEAIALQWRDVTERTVTIRHGARASGETKTGSVRTVPIIGVLADDLANLTRGEDEELVLGIRNWANWRGRVWGPAADTAKVTLPPKMLRHTAASLWIAEHRTSREVAYLMGHSTPRLIERVYGHLFAEAQLDPDRPDIHAAAANARRHAQTAAASKKRAKGDGGHAASASRAARTRRAA